MFFFFLSPVQILDCDNVLQHLTEPTIKFPSVPTTSVHNIPTEITVNTCLSNLCQGLLSDIFFLLYSLFSFPFSVLFPLQSFSVRTQRSPDKRVFAVDF